MIELRWIITGDNRRLQYRQQIRRQNEWGDYTEWSDWKEVESFIE